MASDNLMAMEQLPWSFRSSFADAWISDFFNRDCDAAATKAMQQSFASTSSDGDGFSAEMVDSLLVTPEINIPVQTPAVSGCSEHEASASVSKQRRSLQPNGKVTKRKSRASKRSTTTFITADPANFRQMVQQVTGARFGGLNGQLPAAEVLKPEAKRAVTLLPHSNGLPTLDTSTFFLNAASSLLPPPPPPPSDGAAAAVLDFDSFCSFPTLESWKVM
ncbi:calmodulin-binding protein 25-like [Andrographis paniculata]|uniref:calmodulin-binding protein 25-like n=1 Tax=Andrographis paniculata TaxID=175694 RepID=UPI0021E76430|nr:calmodulin-binding protein 25-like [Andrographis paniculata]